MRTASIVLLLALALVLPVTASGAAQADIDATYTLNVGESATYESAVLPGGANPLYFDQGGVGGDESCSKDLDTYCEHVLVELVNPVADDGNPATDATARRNLSVELTTPAADYDMFVYASDADGTIGGELGRSTAFPIGDTGESVFTSITTRESAPTQHVLVRIVFFAPTTPPTVDIAF